MNITLFNKPYTVRRFGQRKEVQGYYTEDYEEMTVSLDVHPLGTNELKALPEGERTVKRLEGHGTDILTASDQSAGIKGDYLLYDGNWYECVSAQCFDHTILSHWNYQFVLIPADGAGGDVP